MRNEEFGKLLIVIAAIVGLFIAFVSPLAYSIRQGLDLQGGTHVVLEAEDTEEAQVIRRWLVEHRRETEFDALIEKFDSFLSDG